MTAPTPAPCWFGRRFGGRNLRWIDAMCLLPDLAVSGLADGAMARLISPIGELSVRLRLDPGVWIGGCVVHRGGALHLGRCVNRLVQAQATDIGLGAAFYDQAVRLVVEPAA